MSRRKKRRELDLDAARSLARSEALLQSAPLEDQIEKWRAGSSSLTSSQVSNVYDEGLIREQLARNYAFFGDEAMSRVRGGHVVVVGCGGVGSYAALMLARSGVSKIRLIDFDYVTLSSLNRHATALLSDVGTPKVTCVERTIRQVAKWVHVDARIEIWRKDEGGGQLLEGADWVVGELCDRCETA
jgi:tRNA A37 threonylcarbamoyladenosine dehydratase